MTIGYSMWASQFLPGSHYSRAKWRYEQAECNVVLEWQGLLALGFACHFGLGQFVAVEEERAE